MKQLLLFFALSFGMVDAFSAVPCMFNDKPENIIILDVIIEYTADHYSSALSVTIRVFDANNQVIAVAQTSPGQTVTLSNTGNERRAMFIYDMGSGQTNYVIEDVVH